MDLNKKGVKITSRFIDLGLPEDKKPMSLSNHKNGQRWGWVKDFDVDYDKDRRSEYNVAEKPNSFPRNAAFWLEDLIKEPEEKLTKEYLMKEERYVQQKKHYDSVLQGIGENNKQFIQYLLPKKPSEPPNTCIGNRTVAIGTNDEIYVTGDFGLLGAVLEAYNHHWNLKVSPDDFWIPVAVRIGSKINDVAKSNKVRDFFVDFDGKKEIVIYTGAGTIYNVDYVWLFDQFSEKIKENIKKDEYTELMTSNFSTTTPVSRIASQINIMASLQEYFEYTIVLSCGIKGIEMLGNLEDWQQLIKKIDKLAELLYPLEEELQISGWLKHVRMVYVKLKETFEQNPDQDWWSRIISKVPLGSGGQKKYEGWIIQFLEGSDFHYSLLVKLFYFLVVG